RLTSQSDRSDAVAAAQQDLDVSRAILEDAWAKLEADRKSLDDRTRQLESREREATCAEGRLRLEREWLDQERSRLESMRFQPAVTSDAASSLEEESRIQDELRRLESDRSALESARAEIERVVASQQSARLELTERENHCRELQNDIESARLALQTKSEAFAAEQSAFQAAQDELAAERDRLAREWKNLEHERSGVQAGMQALSHSQLESAAWFEQQTAELAELDRRRRELSEQEAAFGERETDLAARAAALTEKEREQSQRTLALETENSALTTAREALARREAESLDAIAAQRAIVESLRDELAQRETALTTERSEIECARQRLEQSRSELESAQAQLDAARSELESHRAELQAARQKLDDETEWLRQDQKHIETVHDEIAADRRTLLKEREELEALRSRLEGTSAAPRLDAAAVHQGPGDPAADAEPKSSIFAEIEPAASQPADETSSSFAAPAFEVPDVAGSVGSAFEPAFPSPFAPPAPVESNFRTSEKSSFEGQPTNEMDRSESGEESSSGFSMAGAFALPAASPFVPDDVASPFRSHPTPEQDRIEEGFAEAAFDFRPEVPAASAEEGDELPRMPRIVSEESSGFRLPRGLDEGSGFRRPSLVNRGWGESDSSRLFSRGAVEDADAEKTAADHGQDNPDIEPSESASGDRGSRANAPGELAKGGDDLRVQELRSQLAALFDLKKNAESGSTRDEAHGVTEEAEPEVDDRGIDIQGLLGSLRGASEEQPESETAPPEPEPVQPPARDVVVKDIDDSESVAAYMEQLFARNRRSGGELVPEPTMTPKPRVPAPEPERPRTTDSLVVEAPSAEALESAKAGLSEPAIPAPIPEPLHKPNRDAIRASIHSLRQVANLNARTALAKHSGQQARSTLQLKATLAFVAVGLASSLLVPGLLGSMGLRAYGWALIGVGLVATTEVLMTMRRIRSARTSKGGDSGVGDLIPATPADPELPPSPDDHPSA
ncbi:MAG: hypothetical protein IT428_06670, partial [Planctomycetaceae bacterium]|nr:hypothetical protein [Planctomycetaceae bacterium]